MTPHENTIKAMQEVENGETVVCESILKGLCRNEN